MRRSIFSLSPAVNQGGKFPSRIIASRQAMNSNRLISKTRIVARPTRVRPTKAAPSHSKCRRQRSLRGWNRRTTRPDSGSMPAMLGPLWLLQKKQERAKLSAVVGPRCLRAMIWSIWWGKGEWVWGKRQSSHRDRERSQTNRSSVVSIGEVHPGSLQGEPSLRPKDAQQVPRASVALDLSLFFGG